jgi:molybdopterin-guanine dinucleotide biosynthesis protein A
VPDGITLGILAGGRATRLDGADKATLTYAGRRLLERTCAALSAPEDATRLLSHRAADGAGLALAHGMQRVVDLRDGQPGPLAGLEALLAATRTPWLLTAPVDLRDIPDDLGARLRAHAHGSPSSPSDAARATVVADADGLQPLVALWPVAPSLAAVRAALDARRLAVRELLAVLPHDLLDIAPHRLGNLNTPADFAS